MIKQILAEQYYSWLLFLLFMKAVCTDHRITIKTPELLEWVQGRATYQEINESPLLGEICFLDSRVFVYYHPKI